MSDAADRLTRPATIDPQLVDYAESELRHNRFMEPAYLTALDRLVLPTGSTGLDVGCGPGGLFPLLDRATGGQGHIVGIDISLPHLARAKRFIDEHALGDRVSVRQADLREPLPFPDDSFDWVWSADVLRPRIAPDLTGMLRELRRVVRPGGIIAVFLTNFYRGILLPGWPYLEQLLHRVSGGQTFSPSQGSSHHEMAAAHARAAGLEAVMRTHVSVEYHAPLSSDVDGYLREYLAIEYGRITEDQVLAAGGTDEDWRHWQELTNPAAATYILDDPDYTCQFVATVTVGRVPAPGADNMTSQRLRDRSHHTEADHGQLGDGQLTGGNAHD